MIPVFGQPQHNKETQMSEPQCSLWCKGRRCPGDAKFVVGVKFACRCAERIRHKGVCVWHMHKFPQVYRCQDCKVATVVSEPIELVRYVAARQRHGAVS